MKLSKTKLYSIPYRLRNTNMVYLGSIRKSDYYFAQIDIQYNLADNSTNEFFIIRVEDLNQSYHYSWKIRHKNKTVNFCMEKARKLLILK
jgi:hypothetical protein